ncbi:hypothetical protein C9439_05705, partial [archaeon SCG-AAA382B04]
KKNINSSTVKQLNGDRMEKKIIKMSKKGQLVVPKEIRKEGDFKASDHFVAIPVENGVIFKKIDLNVKEEFEKLHKKVKEKFAKRGVEENDIEEAVEWARSE